MRSHPSVPSGIRSLVLPAVLLSLGSCTSLPEPEAPGGAVQPQLTLTPLPERQEPQGQEAAPPQKGESRRVASYNQSLSLVIGTESFQALYRQKSPLLDGFWEVEYLQNQDDDIALSGHLQRVGRVPDSSLELGIGLGAYAVAFHDSEHEVFALTLSGGLKVDFGTKIPTALSLEVSVAPEVTTFKDGDSLLDSVLRYEAMITPNAVAIVGGRLFDAETPLSDEVSHEFFVGVRLGF